MTISALIDGATIDGVVLHALEPHHDARGTFTEIFKNAWGSCVDPCQFSVVRSGAGVMRGCHFHLYHDEYFSLLDGEAYVGLRDERPGSLTRNVWSLYHLAGEAPAALTFPRGLVHGWYFPVPSAHLQGVSEPFEDYDAYDNHRVYWLDPDLEIPWPVKAAVMSDAARNAESLAELRRSVIAPMRAAKSVA